MARRDPDAGGNSPERDVPLPLASAAPGQEVREAFCETARRVGFLEAQTHRASDRTARAERRQPPCWRSREPASPAVVPSPHGREGGGEGDPQAPQRATSKSEGKSGSAFSSRATEHRHLDGTTGDGWHAPARRVWTRLFQQGLIDHGEPDTTATHLSRVRQARSPLRRGRWRIHVRDHQGGRRGDRCCQGRADARCGQEEEERAEVLFLAVTAAL